MYILYRYDACVLFFKVLFCLIVFFFNTGIKIGENKQFWDAPHRFLSVKGGRDVDLNAARVFPGKITNVTDPSPAPAQRRVRLFYIHGPRRCHSHALP